MAVGGEAGSRDGADIAQAEDSDLHAAVGLCGEYPRDVWRHTSRRAGGRPSDTRRAALISGGCSLAALVGEGHTRPEGFARSESRRVVLPWSGKGETPARIADQETWSEGAGSPSLEGSGGVPGGFSRDQPARRASATAASWELTPSFCRIDLICERTVETATKAPVAMSSAQCPSMSSARTTRSRSVRAAKSSRRSGADGHRPVHGQIGGVPRRSLREETPRKRRAIVRKSCSKGSCLSMSPTVSGIQPCIRPIAVVRGVDHANLDAH